MTDEAEHQETKSAVTGEPATDRRGASSLAATLLAECAAMVRFWSRLPLPRLGPADDPAAPAPFARAIRMLPWASLVIAAPSAALVALLGPTGLPDLVVGALAVALLAVVTGAFHEDGFADVADGFGGGFTVERRLEIMKDSRIGAFGGVALAAQFVLRASLIGEAVDRFDGLGAGLVVLAVAAMARPLSLVLMVALPPARPDGLGRAAGRPETDALAAALVGGGAVVSGLALPVAGLAATLAALTLAAGAVLALGGLARGKIGGFTGDVVGAGTLTAEIGLLLGLLI